MKDYKKMWEELKESIKKTKNDFETDLRDKRAYEYVEYKIEQIESKN